MNAQMILHVRLAQRIMATILEIVLNALQQPIYLKMETVIPVLTAVMHVQTTKHVRPVQKDLVSWKENVLDVPQNYFYPVENAFLASIIVRNVWIQQHVKPVQVNMVSKNQFVKLVLEQANTYHPKMENVFLVCQTVINVQIQQHARYVQVDMVIIMENVSNALRQPIYPMVNAFLAKQTAILVQILQLVRPAQTDMVN